MIGTEESREVESTYYQAMSEAPPAYKELPGEDLVAELAKMKAMMEQMRLDKERLEADAKRYEMEVKRKEEEEAAVLRKVQEQELAAKEKKELDAVFSLFRGTMSWPGSEGNMDYAWKNAGEEEIKFLRSLEASGETILLALLDMCVLRCSYNQSTTPQNKGILMFVLTNFHLYKCTYIKYVKTSKSTCDVCPITRTETPNSLRENCNSLKTGIFYASKLYSFTNSLQISHAKILSSILSVPKIREGLSENPNMLPRSLLDRVLYALASNRDCEYVSDFRISDALKKFESVIRLIPGNYTNGRWRQLDGFFGMYFNEDTMEVSEMPPPSL